MSTELIRRGAFTLGALLVCLIGLYIPLPGVDAEAWKRIFDLQPGGLLGQANALSGGGVSKLSILSLSITPYVSAAILVQLLAMVSRRLRALGDDERGRARLERYTLVAAMTLAGFQAYGIATALERVGQIVSEPGVVFRLTTVLTLVAGTLFLVWLAGRITARGIGNGIALIIAAGIVNTLPHEIFGLFQTSRQGIVAPGLVVKIVLIIAAITALVVVVERSRRRIPVEFAERRVGTQILPPQAAGITLKLNPAGLMPVYIVGVLVTIVFIVLSIAASFTDISGWMTPLNFALGAPVRLLGSAVLIALLTFVYTAFVCDPEQMAARLAACGGGVPGIAPGEATAAYLDSAITRTTAFGAVYLIIVMVLPEALTTSIASPIDLGGTPILVLVCVVLDLAAEARAYRAPGE